MLSTNSLNQVTPVSQPQIALDVDEAVMTMNALLDQAHGEDGLSVSQDRLYERLKVFAKARGCYTVNGWWMLPKGGKQ